MGAGEAEEWRAHSRRVTQLCSVGQRGCGSAALHRKVPGIQLP